MLNWEKLNEKERASAWDALEEWVWWLRSTYAEAREAVVDCWPAHQDLVRELTALYVWWEDIYEPLHDEAADPDADKSLADPGDEANGRSAVTWHEALHHAVQRWRLNAKCSPSECTFDRESGDRIADWRKRHARTMEYVERRRLAAPHLLGDLIQPKDAAG